MFTLRAWGSLPHVSRARGVYGVISLRDERQPMSTFRVTAIPSEYLSRIRARGRDDFGNPLVAGVNQEVGGPPLRCCLREAEEGERIALIAYQPSTIGGPYAEVGPVFVHADACPGWTGTEYPESYHHRVQLLRAYDQAGNQVDNIVVEPGQAEAGITDLLARPEIAFLHSRNLLAGCWMFTVTRAAA